jgi:excisionase family DNA binding protein
VEFEGELLTSQEVAAQLRISDRTVLAMIARGEFPSAFKAGRNWRISSADVEKFVERQRQRRERQVAASDERER